MPARGPGCRSCNLRMVHVEGTPLAGVSLLRLPGLSWPGAFVFGSRRRRGRKEFVAARAGLPAVVLEAEGGEWDRVVVSHLKAVEMAAELAALLLGQVEPGPWRERERGRDQGQTAAQSPKRTERPHPRTGQYSPPGGDES